MLYISRNQITFLVNVRKKCQKVEGSITNKNETSLGCQKRSDRVQLCNELKTRENDKGYSFCKSRKGSRQELN